MTSHMCCVILYEDDCGVICVSYQITKIVCHLIIYRSRFCTNSDKLRIGSKSVTMLMMLNMSGENSNKHGEYNFNHSARGRGGEQVFTRLNEATYDPLFGTGEFLWHISKQCDSQPMLIFPDKTLPCLCPYLALAIMALYEGLARAGMPEYKRYFVWPNLHDSQAKNAAKRLTAIIRQNMDTSMLSSEQAQQRKKNEFTSFKINEKRRHDGKSCPS